MTLCLRDCCKLEGSPVAPEVLGFTVILAKMLVSFLGWFFFFFPLLESCDCYQFSVFIVLSSTLEGVSQLCGVMLVALNSQRCMCI